MTQRTLTKLFCDFCHQPMHEVAPAGPKEAPTLYCYGCRETKSSAGWGLKSEIRDRSLGRAP